MFSSCRSRRYAPLGGIEGLMVVTICWRIQTSYKVCDLHALLLLNPFHFQHVFFLLPPLVNSSRLQHVSPQYAPHAQGAC